MKFRKVALALSGGVDSAVTGYLLKQKGFDVQAIFMKNWDSTDEVGFCSSSQDAEDAQYVSKKLQFPLRQINFVKEYWNHVFGSFMEDYSQGLTPNPDILCNRNIKFNYFYKYAIETLKCDCIATGHYAGSSFGPFLENYVENRDVRLLEAEDHFKDQTFFLSQVPQECLRKTMFPLGQYNKHFVKELADQIGFVKIAKKKESIGICFIGDRTFQSFINEYIEAKPGKFIDIDTGQTVGEHLGIHNWTLGQRCRISGCLKPYFVHKKDVKTDTIYVAAGTDHPLLYTDIVYTKEPHWICGSPFKHKNWIECSFRFQHTKPLTKCLIYKANQNADRLILKLEEPLRSITPGQYAVFYKDGECLGSSRIVESGPTSNFE